jgi:CBS domain-containing membrane protein
MTQNLPGDLTRDLVGEDAPELELTDDDILDAMQHISGYLDISTEDFRAIYHLAHRHALERLFVGVTAGRLMRRAVKPLQPDTTLDIAARTIADSCYKGLPVVDANGHVIGMLTETDYLKRLKADNFLGLLLKMLEDSFEFTHRCHETPVSAAMTQPAVTVSQDAGFLEILEAFHGHGGRSMPVVGADGRLLGLLLRKDFFAAYKLKESL